MILFYTAVLLFLYLSSLIDIISAFPIYSSVSLSIVCIPLHKLFIFFQVFCCEPLQLWVWVSIFLYHFISTTDLFLISRRLVSSITCWLFLCIILLTCCLCWFWCLISSWLLCWLCNLISCLQQTRRRGINGDWRPLQGLWLFPFFFFLPPLFLAQRVCLNPTLFE